MVLYVLGNFVLMLGSYLQECDVQCLSLLYACVDKFRIAS